LTTKARAEMEELALRVQATLSLATKAQAQSLLNIIVSCLENTLVDHLAKDGYSIKLGGFGKFMLHHRPSKRRKIGFSVETREIPLKCKVKFVGLGKLRKLAVAS
jgi:nucleoid DNA-binding protein